MSFPLPVHTRFFSSFFERRHYNYKEKARPQARLILLSGGYTVVLNSSVSCNDIGCAIFQIFNHRLKIFFRQKKSSKHRFFIFIQRNDLIRMFTLRYMNDKFPCFSGYQVFLFFINSNLRPAAI